MRTFANDQEIREFVRFHCQRFTLSRADIMDVEEFRDAFACLRRGDQSAVEWGVAFIEADSWHFHSGYNKQRAARFLRRLQLSESQQERIRAALLLAIGQGGRIDLDEYSRLARRIENLEFRAQLSTLADSQDEGLAYRANFMLGKCEMNDYRTNLRGAR